jgi:hypothetical protein
MKHITYLQQCILGPAIFDVFSTLVSLYAAEYTNEGMFCYCWEPVYEGICLIITETVTRMLLILQIFTPPCVTV